VACHRTRDWDHVWLEALTGVGVGVVIVDCDDVTAVGNLGWASTLIVTAIVGRWRAWHLEHAEEKKRNREEEEIKFATYLICLDMQLIFACTLDRTCTLCATVACVQVVGWTQRLVLLGGENGATWSDTFVTSRRD
jgi:hypothetical protein